MDEYAQPLMILIFEKWQAYEGIAHLTDEEVDAEEREMRAVAVSYRDAFYKAFEDDDLTRSVALLAELDSFCRHLVIHPRQLKGFLLAASCVFWY